MSVCFTGCVNNLTDTITPPPGYYDVTPVPEVTTAPSDISPVLYKISDGTGAFVWLFGSIGCEKEVFYPLPDYVMNAFENSEYFVVEYDRIALSTSALGQQVALSHMLYQDDITISDCISSETYEEAVGIISENAIYNDKYDKYIAAYWATMIDGFTSSKIGDESQDSVEKFLTVEAKEQNKTVVEMEAFDFNHQMMAGFSKQLQETLLKDSIEQYKNPDELLKETNSIMEAWTEGNPDKLRALSEETTSSNWNKETCDEYIEKKYTQRNDIIVNQIESSIATGEETFFCVIYTNVFSEGGIADILAEKGYTVEIIKG